MDDRSTVWTIGRRQFITGAAAAGIGSPLIARLAAAQQLEKVRYLTPFGYLIGFAETMYAQTGGFFAKHGLDVEIEGGRGSAMSVQQVSAGNVLLSRTGGTDLIKAFAKDPSIVSIGEIFQRDIFFVISTQAKPIRTPKDMAGKTIGVVSKSGATENILDMMLAKDGVAQDSVKRENVGNAPAAFEFINQGRIDAYIATSDTVYQLQVEKKPVHAWSTDTVAPCPGQVYITSRKTVAEKADSLARFFRAVQETLGVMLAMKDLKPVVDSMNSKYQVVESNRPDKGLTVLQNSLKNLAPAHRDKLASDPGGWRSAYDLMVKAKIVEPLPRTDFHTDEIRKRAFG